MGHIEYYNYDDPYPFTREARRENGIPVYVPSWYDMTEEEKEEARKRDEENREREIERIKRREALERAEAIARSERIRQLDSDKKRRETDASMGRYKNGTDRVYVAGIDDNEYVQDDYKALNTYRSLVHSRKKET